MTRDPSDSRLDLGMDAAITRRDFVNGALVGASALLTASGPAGAAAAGPFAPSGSAWTGYGGVGDYSVSNGNTEQVRDAAHLIRDGAYEAIATSPVEESWDVVVIGGGFSGVTAAYEFSRQAKPGQSCLLLENHPVIGGEAKQNDLDVDGIRLTGPQGSNESLVPVQPYGERYEVFRDYWHEIGMPTDFPLVPLAGGAEKYHIPNSHYDPMVIEREFDVGYYFGADGWRTNPWKDAFRSTPWPENIRRDVDDFFNNRRDGSALPGAGDGFDRFLDSMSYRELLDRLGYGPEISSYVNPLIGVGNYGVCSDAISAYAARRLTLPGTIPSGASSRFSNLKAVSFPGGNATILRTMLKRMIPDAIQGDGGLLANATAPFNPAAFDRPGQAIRLRLSSTVVRVEHDGPPDKAERVFVTYARNGRLHRVAAKAVVVGAGGWVARRIVRDLPSDIAEAYSGFNYGPVMTANIGLRHWRFFDRLGIIAARWFDGLGWEACIRRDVDLTGNARPLTPDSPIMLTLYIPILRPGEDMAAQGAVARQYLLDTSYATFERQIREQLTAMFGSHGFDARRDIAGIVLNRWGHAYFAPSPGFFFGKDGKEAPHETIRRSYGRIRFAHSELQGNMNMAHAMLEARRGARQAAALI
ncbi:NAD(P)-binding protein [Rhizorhabdus histidinilytica]|uniref:NAD(P)-binding protein n=1 Tax=Rhizorhabdus histidinilytica TaxID=439228 RepID=UPI00321F62B4